MDTSKKFLIDSHSVQRFREKFPEMAYLSEPKIYARCQAMFLEGVCIVEQAPADTLLLVIDKFSGREAVFVCTESDKTILLKTVLNRDHAKANIYSGVVNINRGRGVHKWRAKSKDAKTQDYKDDPKRKLRYKRKKKRGRDEEW